MQLHDEPTILIDNINSCAKGQLRKHGRGGFHEQIAIKPPPSTDNHIKNRDALMGSIRILRSLNIASTINSGRDVLGQAYEQFLKYANDAKELGIVLTPRHITRLAAEMADVQKKDIVFDPACGTGGFLVAALDKVRKDGGSIENFKKGSLYGVEQDPLVATLAIVNMIFRGDGSSTIAEGDCFKSIRAIPKKATKVLMNPPFADKDHYEWKFVDRALEQMEDGGLLFAVLPTTVMGSSDDSRDEITWRKELLKGNTLISVISLPKDLFTPHVSKGTYGVLIRKGRPHVPKKDRVVWAILHDGVRKTKTQRSGALYSNTEEVKNAVKNYIASGTKPRYRTREIDCSYVNLEESHDLSPENHVGKNDKAGEFDLSSIHVSRKTAAMILKQARKPRPSPVKQCGIFPLSLFMESCERGKSGRAKNLQSAYGQNAALPLISTSEDVNGISTFVHVDEVAKVYEPHTITVSANGGVCYAHYHEYEYAANNDVFVIHLKGPKFDKSHFAVFLCAAVNNESWRYNYYRKLSRGDLENLRVRLPVDGDGEIDFAFIKKTVKENEIRG